MIRTAAMKLNNGYNEVLFPVKSPVNDQSIVQMRQIIIFWHFDLFLLLFARGYTFIHLYTARFFTHISLLNSLSYQGLHFRHVENRYMPKIHRQLPHFIVDFGQGWNQTNFGGHEVNEVHEPLCHMMQTLHCKVTTNVRLFGLYPVSTSLRRCRSLKWSLFKDIHPGFPSRRQFWP